jgi:putative oxidoreductase
MKHVPLIAASLLGLVFSAIGLLSLLGKMPPPPEAPAGSLVALFMGAFVPSGYMTFVKAMELIGGILVAIPRTRNWGLLVLGPIIINIMAFHIFVAKGGIEVVHYLICALAAYLLWVGRKAFAGLLN